VTFELTYKAQIVPGFLVQPDFQYIFHAGGRSIHSIPLQAAFPTRRSLASAQRSNFRHHCPRQRVKERRDRRDH
jgi:hypothetical protein